MNAIRPFTDQKRFVVSAEEVERWRKVRNQDFACRMCDHEFIEGDGVRWVYCGDVYCTNLLVCDACDGPDAKERWKRVILLVKEKSPECLAADLLKFLEAPL